MAVAYRKWPRGRIDDNPAGSDGATDQEITDPPLEVGVTVVMAVSLVSVSVLGV